jgi:CPA2 family monovalent cation:H+ antiporter-2
MAGPVDIGIYKDALVVLGTAAVLVPAMYRLKVSPILGFLLAGVVVGPHALGQLAETIPWLGAFSVSDPEAIRAIGEFGVVFLLFVIGLEIPLERLLTMRRLVFGLGALQLGLLAGVIAAPLAFLGLGLNAAIIAGFALALSSTALVVDLLARGGRLATGTGRVALPILLFEDLAVVPVLFLIGALGGSSGGSLLTGVAWAIAQAILAIVLIVLAGRLVLRPLFRMVSKTDAPELFMAAALFVVVATAALTGWLGLSMALGAFVAGLLLAETEYRKAIEAMLEPFKGLLLGVFFLSVGMQFNLDVLASEPVVVVGGALAVIAVKTGLLYALIRAFRIPRRHGIEASLLLAPGGEFAFVVVGLAMAERVIGADLGTLLLGVVSVSLFALPVLDALGRAINRRLSPLMPQAAPDAPTGEELVRVFVAGHGRVGDLVCAMLEHHKVSYLCADTDLRNVNTGRAKGRPVFFGDATNPGFLRRCGLDRAQVAIITVQNPKATDDILRTMRGMRPDMPVVARASDAGHAAHLYALGATDAVPETIEASLQLSEASLVRVGVPMGLIIASIHEKRDEFRTALQQAAGPNETTHAVRPRRTGTGGAAGGA